MAPVFEPHGIAVVGVSSTREDKPGNIIVANLGRMGRNDVYCVNPRGGSIDIGGITHTVYPTVADIPGAVDLAVVTVPAEHTLPVIQACAEAGIRGVILISGGFSEVRKNVDIESQIRALADTHGLRIMGPNCLGIVYPGREGRYGINTFFIPDNPLSEDSGGSNVITIPLLNEKFNRTGDFLTSVSTLSRVTSIPSGINT